MFMTILLKQIAGSALISSGLIFGSACTSTHASDSMAAEKVELATADIVDKAISAGSFSTLVAAVQAAGLEETLRGDGPFTVFAPTDEAFANLPAGTVESLLLPENKDKLVSILTYHVLPGKVTSSAIVGKTFEVATVQGSTVAVNGTDGVMVDGANVVTADIRTSNGVIHVIDAVILP